MFVRNLLDSLKLRPARPAVRPTRRHDARRRCRLALEWLEDRLTPAAIIATTFADVVDPNDGLLGLREAIALAADPATHAGDDTIALPHEIGGVAGTYALSLGQLIINDATGKLTILCDGGPATIDAQGNSRVFFLSVGSEVAFQGLTITGGSDLGGGGGILNLGTLTLIGSTLSGNSAPFGGGILSQGIATLTVTDSTFSGNSATRGGGIFNSGTVALIGSTLSGNSATQDGGGILNLGTAALTGCIFSGNSADYGGGILNTSNSALTVTDCTFSGNSATSYGGGIWNDGTASLTVAASLLSGNSAVRSGGGIWNDGAATITSSTLDGNRALVSDGGGVLNGESATLTVIDSTVSANRSVNYGGGIYNSGTATVAGSAFSVNSANFGGGINNDSFTSHPATLTVTDCTFSGNKSGGINNGDSLTVTDSTFSGNEGSGLENSGTATVAGSVFSGNSGLIGAGIANGVGTSSGTLIVTDSTISGNAGEGIYSTALLTVTGSIVSGNTGEGMHLEGVSGQQLLGNTITGNGKSGVFLARIFAGGVTNNSLIGTLTAGNVIAFNGGAGVAVVGPSTGIAIRGNALYGNAGPGIDLGNDGLTANDPGDADDGPNHLQNAPVLVLARSDAAGTTVSGTLNGAPDARFLIDFYATPPAGSPPGMTYIGSALVQTDGGGNVDFEATLPPRVAAGWGITAAATTTATAPFGDTSELALGVPVFDSTPPNRSPEIANQSFAVNENSANGTVVGTVAASDPDAGQALTYQITAGNAPGAFAIDAGTGRITVANAAALDYEATPALTLSVQVTDSGSPALSGTATVTVSLNNVNEAPVNSVPSFPQSVAKNRTLTFSRANGNAITIADPDAGTAVVQVSLSVLHGKLTLAGTAGLTFLVGDGRDDGTMTFRGTIAAVNAALDGLRYTPDKGYAGWESLTITANDLGSGLGDPLIDTDVVAILVEDRK